MQTLLGALTITVGNHAESVHGGTERACATVAV
jgi:hypothetical protein